MNTALENDLLVIANYVRAKCIDGTIDTNEPIAPTSKDDNRSVGNVMLDIGKARVKRANNNLYAALAALFIHIIRDLLAMISMSFVAYYMFEAHIAEGQDGVKYAVMALVFCALSLMFSNSAAHDSPQPSVGEE